jgi:hypothetical protein
MISPLRKTVILLSALTVPVALDAERRLPKRTTNPRRPSNPLTTKRRCVRSPAVPGR